MPPPNASPDASRNTVNQSLRDKTRMEQIYAGLDLIWLVLNVNGGHLTVSTGSDVR